MKRFAQVPTLGLVWAVIGVIVALANDYGEVDSASEVATLILAIITWPLILLGADVAIRF